MKFDELLTQHIGELGRFQILVVIILGLEEFFIGFQTMAPLFLASTPQTVRCRNPDLENVIAASGNCSWDQLAALTSPRKILIVDPENVTLNSLGPYDHCVRYDVNVSKLASEVDFADLCPDENYNSSGSQLSRVVQDSGSGGLVACSEWRYDMGPGAGNLVSEFGLVCDDAWKAKAVASVFFAGRAFGNFAFGWLADRIGRRKVILGAGLTNVILATVTAVSPSLVFLLVVRFFHATVATGKTNTGFIMAMEYSGPSRRVAVGCYYFICWALGYMTLAAVAYLIPYWRWFQLAITLPELIYYVLFFFFVPESPRWLWLQDRTQEARLTLERMARINGTTLPDEIKITQTAERKVSPADLFKGVEIRSITLILLFVWGTCAVLYYGLSFASPGLGVNTYLSCVIGGAIEVPAYVLLGVLSHTTGRVRPFSACMILGAASLFLTLAVPADRHWILLGVSMFGKFLITLAFTILWIYCGEVYPTCIRSMGLTITAIAARITSPLAPYVVLLAAFHASIPAVLLGTFSALAGVLVLRLPETRGRPMAQTLADGEVFIRENRMTLCKRIPLRKTGVLAEEEDEHHQLKSV